MSVSNDIKLDFRDVLIKPRHSSLKSRADVNIVGTFAFSNTTYTWQGVPVVSSNMDTTGTFEMAISLSRHKMLTCIHKHYTVEEWQNFVNDYQEKFSNMDILNYVAVSSGSSDADFLKLQTILQYYNFKFICLDVANGYRDDFMDFIRKVRKTYPEKIIIAGNVVTPEGVKMILDAGANIVKVGIGNGSACATRMKTGIGYPQFSAILECQKIAHDKGGYILSDGGCKDPAEIVKAFGAGADFVMCGGIFAGHKESGGDLVTDAKGQLIKMFYGMSSDTAMQKYAGGVAKYRTSEGLTIKIPYKGEVEKTLLDICGGIRSACTYLNSSNIRELHDNVEFVRVNNIK